ncbi:hypothetical protein DZG01_18065 [Pseudomonas fluorescens]|nr:hypothetical protein DZG01_18065 [Pseudomonas fluorescens]
MGAGLLAKALAHSTSPQADPPLSRASPLPHWNAPTCCEPARDEAGTGTKKSPHTKKPLWRGAPCAASSNHRHQAI